MKKDDLFYGFLDSDELAEDPIVFLNNQIEEACLTVGETFDECAARLEWPIVVHVYKRMDVGGEQCADTIAQRIIESTLDDLDEEHANPYGDPTEPTQAIKDAALAFGRAVVADYVSWMCEPNGETITYTLEDARKIIEGDTETKEDITAYENPTKSKEIG